MLLGPKYAIENNISRLYFQFSDKLEDMLENLTSTVEQVQHAEPISAHPDKLREQISENSGLMEDMEMRQSALESVKSTAEELIKQAGDSQDIAVQGMVKYLWQSRCM